MPVNRKRPVMRSGATPGAAGTMSNPGGVGRTRAPKPIYQGPRSPGAAGTMSNPGRVGMPMPTAPGRMGGARPMGATVGTTSSIPRRSAGRRTGPMRPIDPSDIGRASVSKTFPAPAGAGSRAVDSVVRGADEVADVVKATGKTNAKKGLGSMMKNKRGLAIGLGAAVVGGLAYSGRRGEGSSGGRTSQFRY